MEFSVVTVGYKSPENIKRFLTEVEKSIVKPKEVIVLINFSETSITQNILEIVQTSPIVTRWVYFSQNTGVGLPWNLGIELSTSDVVIIQNDDAIVAPETYKIMVDGFDHEKVGIVGVKQGGFTEDVKFTATGFLHAFRRSMIESIGGFWKESYPLACERELGLRAWTYGFETKIVQAPFAHEYTISANPDTEIIVLGEKMVPSEFQQKSTPIIFEQCRRYNQILKVQSEKEQRAN